MALSKFLFAAGYDVLNTAVEWRIARYRRLTAGIAQGDVLEVGGGSGANLNFYPSESRVTMLDPNPYMARRLRRRAEKLCRSVSVVEGEGEDMPFAAASFDTVVTTLVLCMVSDIDQVVAEIKRVLRPDGTFLFYEHVAATSALGKALQTGLNPAWRWLTTGCHLDRDIEQTIRIAGFRDFDFHHFNIRFGTPVALPNLIGRAVL